MAGTAITTLHTYIDDYVDNASSETGPTNRAIIATVRDFCRFTHLWQETLADISVVADTAAYTLTAPTTYGDVVEVDGLVFCLYKENGLDDDQYAPLEIKSREWLDKYDKQWEYRTAPTPRMAFFDKMITNKMILVDTPTVASTDGLSVRVWLQPGLTATTVLPGLISTYTQTLTYGAAAHLMRMPNQRWSNAKLGDYYHNLYMDGRMNAQQDQDRGFADLENYRVIPEGAFTGGSRNSRFPSGTGTV
jgi:hypothetical protein